MEISDPVLLYIRTKSEILTGNKEILGNIWEIPPKGQKQAISGALPSKWKIPRLPVITPLYAIFAKINYNTKKYYQKFWKYRNKHYLCIAVKVDGRNRGGSRTHEKMENKINTIREIVKSKGYAMNRSWTIETKTYKITNCKWGGKMMMDFWNKIEKTRTNTNYDAVIAELKDNANGEMWYE